MGKNWERIPQPMQSYNLWELKINNQSIDKQNKSWNFESCDEYITTVKTLYT